MGRKGADGGGQSSRQRGPDTRGSGAPRPARGGARARLLAVDLLLHGAAGDEAVHDDVARLADAVRAVHGLVVLRRRRRRARGGAGARVSARLAHAPAGGLRTHPAGAGAPGAGARACAGFQEGSTMTTRSAAVSVRPRPPTCAAPKRGWGEGR